MEQDRKDECVAEEIFPKNNGRSYTLVEVVRGESPMVDRGPEDTVFSYPLVFLWEGILFLGVTLLLTIFSVMKNAPLEEMANPLVTTNPAKAPWYFMGLQELLEHMHPTLAGVLVPAILVLFLVSIPYLDVSRAGSGQWFGTEQGRSRGRWIAGLTAAYALVVVPLYILLDEMYSIREALRDQVAPWIGQGLVPGAILALIVTVPTLVLWRFRPTKREILICLFTVALVAAIVLTVTGFLFRGPGFELYLPGQMPADYNPWDGL